MLLIFQIPVFLFQGTVEDNLTIGLTDVSHKKMSDLCQLLELEVPLATVVGYDHALSTGQIQKIKIIRALLDERTIPIFDEIFSNLSKKNPS
ncbi:ABC transporter ATP-binding protein [Lacticaseibacillus casei]|nr:ABC transporter ATP-binding protein [Lacticaseibacillus casei]